MFLDLHSLSVEGSTSHTSTDGCFVSVHGILDHAAPAVIRARVPLASPKFSDRAHVAIPLLLRDRRVEPELGVAPGWNQHAHRSPFSSLMDGLVEGLGIVRTVY